MKETSSIDYELWFRQVYAPLIKDKAMTAALRPGDRRWPNSKGVRIGDKVSVRVLKSPGVPEHGLDPVFDTPTAECVITDVTVKPLKDMTDNELRNCSPDSQTWLLGAYQLGLIYNEVFSGNEIVSLIEFSYSRQGER